MIEMAIKLTYSALENFQPKSRMGVAAAFSSDGQCHGKKVETYGTFAKKILKNKKYVKSISHGGQDGPETSNVLYSDEIVTVIARDGSYVEFATVERYEIKSGKHSWVTPNARNCRFWKDCLIGVKTKK